MQPSSDEFDLFCTYLYLSGNKRVKSKLSIFLVLQVTCTKSCSRVGLNFETPFLLLTYSLFELTMPASTRSIAELMRDFNLTTKDEPSNGTDIGFIMAQLLESLTIMVEQPSPKWNEQVIDPMGEVEKVAGAALKNLLSIISHPNLNDIRRLCRIAQAINLITIFSTHESIRDAFLKQHSIKALVKAMDSLSPLPVHPLARDSASVCISCACLCLSNHIFAHDGLRGIIEAFSSGILRVLMGCADLLNTDDELYFTLLRHELPRFIIYPSVLRRVQGSLKTIEVPLQAGQSPASKKAWEAFEQLTLSVEGINQVKDTGVDHGLEGCANGTVSLFIYSWFGGVSKRILSAIRFIDGANYGFVRAVRLCITVPKLARRKVGKQFIVSDV